MININEIRIGNIVCLNESSPEKKEFIGKPHKWELSDFQYPQYYSPIQLTEEIILKCGFEEIENPLNWNYKMRVQALNLLVRCNAGHLYMEFGDIYLADMIKTVHHLQNFCQSFGRELIPTF